MSIRRLARNSLTQGAEEWSRAVQQLSQDLHLAAQDEFREITHTECEAHMPSYISRELQSATRTEIDLAISHHLQTCPSCAATYALLKYTFVEETGTAVADLPTRTEPLSFLRPPEGVAWFQVNSSKLLARNPHLTFLLNPRHVNQLVSNAQVWSGRDAEILKSESLLLHDEAKPQEQTIQIRAWLIRSAHSSDRFHIRLRVMAPTRLKKSLRVQLHWAEQKYEASLKAGETIFEDLAPPAPPYVSQDRPSSQFRLTLFSY